MDSQRADAVMTMDEIEQMFESDGGADKEAVKAGLAKLVDQIDVACQARDVMEQVIVKAYVDGLFSPNELAEMSGLSRPTIYTVLDRHGVDRPRLK